MTTESEISELYELIEVFIQDNFSEIIFGSGELKCGMFLWPYYMSIDSGFSYEGKRFVSFYGEIMYLGHCKDEEVFVQQCCASRSNSIVS